ncbi:MAG: HAD-IIB family hydrolase [Spirochaetales bacterium]|nr:HAD-IIB family hydrolase [Spirochaetales bacterium]
MSERYLKNSMQPLSAFNPSAHNIKFIFTDVDDTLTENGKLSPESYSALWRLRDSGFKIIPVTGGSAGLGHMIVRQWPVDAVIAESGALVYYMDDSQLKTFIHPSVADGKSMEKLNSVYDSIKKEFPLIRKAKDQFSRLYDLAIDYNEDYPRLGYETAVKIKGLCETLGAEAMISSIHVNIWFGDYCKKRMVELFAREHYGLTVDELKEKAIYCGDSPNDEPMFELLPLSFAVANILNFKNELTHEPAYYAPSRCGRGFVEIAEKLLGC